MPSNPSVTTRHLHRRGLLRIVGLTTIGGLAGCAGRGDGDGSGGNSNGGGAGYGGGGGGGAQQPAPSKTPTPTTTATTRPPVTTTHAVEDTSPTRTADRTATASETPPATERDEQLAFTVPLENVAFEPIRLEVPLNSTVTWVNEDAFGHDVTATQFHDVAESWDFEATLSGGQSVSYTFETAGVYEYLCTIHGRSSMCGVVLVDGATLEDPLPCEDQDEGY